MRKGETVLKKYDIIKNVLTNESDGLYTESLKTVKAAFAPVSISDFFVSFWGMRAENIQYQPEHSLTAFSESPANSFFGGLLRKVKDMINTINQKITFNTVNCLHKARNDMQILWERTDNIFIQKELKKVSEQLAKLSIAIMDADASGSLFWKGGK